MKTDKYVHSLKADIIFVPSNFTPDLRAKYDAAPPDLTGYQTVRYSLDVTPGRTGGPGRDDDILRALVEQIERQGWGKVRFTVTRRY